MRTRLKKGRYVAIVCILLSLFAILGFDLVKIQVIEGDEYKAKANAVTSKVTPITAARGEIVDCNGKKLVYNEQGYNLIFDAAYFPSTKEQEQRNEIILSLINLLEKNELEWIDNLPLVLDSKGNVQYKEDSDALIATMKGEKLLNLNDYATAQNCYDALVEEYSLSSYEKKDAIKIASVCFEMDRTYFSAAAPYTFAKDIPEDVVSIIKENSSFYLGVDVDIVPVRIYADGTLAPHILGMSGPIDAEEYKEKKSEGYKVTDIIGKNGIESAMESYLKGTDGEKATYTDKDGNKTTEVTIEPKQGNTVVLTIDSEMQKVAQDSLAAALRDFEAKGNMVPSAGAVVVLSCKDSSILACATYPSYDLTTYADDVKELSENKAAPLWNRALLSTYATGSTAKPSVAVAALEEGMIDEDFTVYCNGTYTYLGQSFKCEQGHETRFVNVVNAIDESCNTFFMEVGRMIGIEKMNEYRTMLGLGAKTGCELSESTGILDSPEYRASLGQEWLPGYTVQSAIGQAGNLFTPIQLANYVNTIANGGTRYKTHFVKSIKSADYSETLVSSEPEIACQTGISAETLDIVKRGMLEVGTTGYCRKYFQHLPVKVACKTGTSQEIRKINGYSQKINNGFLIAFAPYDNPEIAIAAVGEGLTSGVFVAPCIAAIVEYYCGQTDESQENARQNVLIP